MRLDAEGRVIYASPNAVSNFHRLGVIGQLRGEVLAEVVTQLLEESSSVEETLAVVVMGRAAWRTEVEVRGVTLSLRAVPLTDRGERRGALLLCRDVSEVRRRERELITKDATIREIHHRVKNNLQTVSALLRLQARRSDNPETKDALEEAERRVSTIALVHETLSQNIDEVVDFDEVFGRVLRLAADVASPDSSVRTVVEGSFGLVGAEAATTLAVVLTELVTNAVEHGLHGRSGTVTVHAERDGAHLEVRVRDDGHGIEDGHGAHRARDPDRQDPRHRRARRGDRVAGAARGRHRGGPERAPARAVSAGACGRRVRPRLAGRPVILATGGSRPRRHDDAAGLPAASWWCSVASDQPARRARAVRRLSARRSSSLRPPHTPES